LAFSKNDELGILSSSPYHISQSVLKEHLFSDSSDYMSNKIFDAHISPESVQQIVKCFLRKYHITFERNTYFDSASSLWIAEIELKPPASFRGLGKRHFRQFAAEVSTDKKPLLQSVWKEIALALVEEGFLDNRFLLKNSKDCCNIELKDYDYKFDAAKGTLKIPEIFNGDHWNISKPACFPSY
jgi:hypothetical protein